MHEHWALASGGAIWEPLGWDISLQEVGSQAQALRFFTDRLPFLTLDAVQSVASCLPRCLLKPSGKANPLFLTSLRQLLCLSNSTRKVQSRSELWRCVKPFYTSPSLVASWGICRDRKIHTLNCFVPMFPEVTALHYPLPITFKIIEPYISLGWYSYFRRQHRDLQDSIVDRRRPRPNNVWVFPVF